MNMDNFLIGISSTEFIINLLFQIILITSLSWITIRFLKKISPPLKSLIISVTLFIALMLPISTTLIKDFIPSPPITLQPIEFTVSSLPTHQKPGTSELIISENLIFPVWGIGFFAMFTKLLIGIKRTGNLINASSPSDSIKLNSILQRSFKKFPNLRFRGIYLSSMINSPISAGFLKPIIIIPEAIIDGSSNQELAAIIDHELSHIYHKDHITGLLQRFAATIYWWNPFIHLLNSELSNTREHIADNYAIRSTSPICYAKCLTSLTEKALISRKNSAGVLSFSSSTMGIKERIVAVVKQGRRMETSVKGGVAVSTLILVLITSLTLSSYRIHINRAPAKDNPVPPVPIPGSSVAVSKKRNINPPAMRISYLKRPKLVKKVPPAYPKDAVKKRISGPVLLEATTDIYGKVQEARVISSANPVLNEASINAIKQWVYEPYIVDGKTLPVKFTVNVTYSLSK